MKTLYESLLDDFEELGSKQDKAVRAEILKGAWFRLGADSKTIIFEPSALDHLVDDRDTVPGVYWEDGGNHDRNISDLSVCKDLGLKFQPLNFVIDDIAGKDSKWLKYFDCEYAVNFSMITGQGTTPDIDLSVIKFPIKGSISISGYANKINSLKPYPHPVEMVRILREPATPSVLAGWKCKHMVITSINNVVFHLLKNRKDNPGVTTEEYDQILIEWVNEILKNNPDVENLYLGQCSNYSDNRRVVTKGRGANRVCVKLSHISQAKWNALIYNDVNPVLRGMANEVEAWRRKHEDLFECECAPAAAGAATPGDTMGMGNPMAPTATEPGTEPLIPKHPRNKKKRKSLKESLLDDFDTLEANADPRAEIEEFLKQNFMGEWIISKKPNKDGLYEVSSGFSVYGKQNKLTTLTNGLFIWTKVKGSFSCHDCANLTSLEGGPKEVDRVYHCSHCPKLETLKGGPELAGYFICSWNDNLVSLEGGPKTVLNDFDCSYCPKLKSLKGAPKTTGKCFTCNYCGKKFSVEEVEKYTKAKKIINI